MHLAGLPQTLKFNLVLNVYGGLPLLESLAKVIWVDRTPIGLTNEQTVILVFPAKESLVCGDLLQSAFQLMEQRCGQVLFAYTAISFGVFQNQSAF